MVINVGVIGAGNIAQSRHLPTYDNDSRTNIRALYDTDHALCRSISSDFDAEPVGDINDLFETVDLVSICTPPSEHCRQTIKGLQNGCHVITEKPMAMSIDEADRMITEAEKSRKQLSVVHNFKFMGAVRRARKIVESGDLGEILRVNAIITKREGQSKTYVEKSQEKGEIGIKFWDESPHMVYLLESFLGEMSLTKAVSQLNQNEDGYKRISATFSSADSGEGTMSFYWDSPITEWWIVVTGSQGVMFIDIYRNILVKFDREENHGPLRVIKVLMSANIQLITGGLASGAKYIYNLLFRGYKIPDAGFSFQIQQMVSSVEAGTPPPVSGQEGKVVLKHMLDIQEEAGISI